MPLEELRKYIDREQHLPNVPPGSENRFLGGLEGHLLVYNPSRRRYPDEARERTTTNLDPNP